MFFLDIVDNFFIYYTLYKVYMFNLINVLLVTNKRAFEHECIYYSYFKKMFFLLPTLKQTKNE